MKENAQSSAVLQPIWNVQKIFRNSGVGTHLLTHMLLMGCPNPYELQQSWEYTILKVFPHTKLDEHQKKISLTGFRITS